MTVGPVAVRKRSAPVGVALAKRASAPVSEQRVEFVKVAPIDPATAERGIMVALPIPLATAKRLAMAGGEPPERMHITLAYLGKNDEEGAPSLKAITAAIADVAARYPAIEGEIAGRGTFAAGGPDGVPYWAHLDAPLLAEIRTDIVRALRAAKLPVHEDHGFTPHITISYLQDANDAPAYDGSKQRVTIPKLLVKVGEESARVRLTGKVAKGDVEGHPFHGNQWTGGQGGDATPDMSTAAWGEIKGRIAAQGKGNCYQASATLIMDARALGLQNPTLVQAMALGRGPLEGRAFGHSWIEADGADGRRIAIDFSSRHDVVLDATAYRALAGVDQTGVLHEYTPEQAQVAMIKTEHYGPWTDDVVASAPITKGDLPGHEFHGNQWTGGVGGGDLMSTLDPQTIAHIAAVSAAMANAQPSDHLYEHNPSAPGVWTPERTALHQQLVADIVQRAAGVPQDRQAVIMGGLPGAGKTTWLGSDDAASAGIDRSQFATVSADDIKTTLMGDSNPYSLTTEAACALHEESSLVSKQALAALSAQGTNVIVDYTFSSEASAAARIDSLHAAGYSVTGVFIDTTPAESLSRAEGRYSAGGTYTGQFTDFPLLASTPTDSAGHTPNYNAFVASQDDLDKWISVDGHGFPPHTVASGGG